MYIHTLTEYTRVSINFVCQTYMEFVIAFGTNILYWYLCMFSSILSPSRTYFHRTSILFHHLQRHHLRLHRRHHHHPCPSCLFSATERDESSGWLVDANQCFNITQSFTIILFSHHTSLQHWAIYIMEVTLLSVLSWNAEVPRGLCCFSREVSEKPEDWCGPSSTSTRIPASCCLSAN